MDFVRYPSGETLVGSNPTPLILFTLHAINYFFGVMGEVEPVISLGGASQQ